MSWFEERAGLDGTVAVVTGGAGGLGEAIVRDLAANGVRIATVDIDPTGVERVRGAARHDRDGRRRSRPRGARRPVRRRRRALGPGGHAGERGRRHVPGAGSPTPPRRAGTRCSARTSSTCCTRARSPFPACRPAAVAEASSTSRRSSAIGPRRASPSTPPPRPRSSSSPARSPSSSRPTDPGQQRRTRLHADTEHAPHRLHRVAGDDRRGHPHRPPDGPSRRRHRRVELCGLPRLRACRPT